MNHKPFLLCLSLLLMAVACHQSHSPELKRALQLSGSNRQELKSVLRHYSRDQSDSLKYRAACFLIENMQWHYGPQIKPSDRFWELFLLEDSLVTLRELNPGIEKYDQAAKGYKLGAKKMLIRKAIEESALNYEIRSDLQTLSSEFLIENIEAAFHVWGRDWNKDLSFEDFCEYVLPYRFHDEAVYPVREKLSGFFKKLYYTDTLQRDPHKTISYLNRFFWRMNWDWGDERASLPDIAFYNIFYWHNKSMRCANQVVSLGQLMRAIGLPVLELCIPKWRDMDMGHSGCVIPEPDGTLTYFTALHQQPGTIRRPHRPQLATRMYIKSFSAQPNSAFFLKAPGEVLPPFFNTPCLRDVTPEFVKTRDVKVELHGTGMENNLCWFCVFIRGRWSPTGWGVIDRGTGSVRFKNTPVGLTGIACITDRSGRMIPCSRMFTVTAGGMQCIGLPGEETSLYLLRKFHVKERMLDIGHTIIGTRIQGANRRDFSDSVTLYTIDDTLQVCFQDLVFDNPYGYRYYRVLSPSGNLNIAELEFLTEKKQPGAVQASPLPVFTKNEAFQKIYYSLWGDTLSDRPGSKLFDADMLTWSAQGWAGMDFGRPVKISRVRIAPRNAHNEIVPGDNYQLFYWNGSGFRPGYSRQHTIFWNIPVCLPTRCTGSKTWITAKRNNRFSI